MMEGVGFSIAEAAEILGLTPHVLRAWERRHRPPPVGRTTGGQRRYTQEDLELFGRVKQLVAARGISLRLAFAEAQGDLPAHAEAAVPAPARSAVEGVRSPWHAVADLMPVPVLIVDPSGTVVDANIAFARASGKLRGSLRGARFADLVDPHDRAKAVRGLRPPVRARRGWELNLVTGSGPSLYAFDCWPLADRGHDVVALIGTDLSGSGLELWPGQ